MAIPLDLSIQLSSLLSLLPSFSIIYLSSRFLLISILFHAMFFSFVLLEWSSAHTSNGIESNRPRRPSSSGQDGTLHSTYTQRVALAVVLVWVPWQWLRFASPGKTCSERSSPRLSRRSWPWRVAIEVASERDRAGASALPGKLVCWHRRCWRSAPARPPRQCGRHCRADRTVVVRLCLTCRWSLLVASPSAAATRARP